MVGGDDPDLLESGRVERAAKELDPLGIPFHLVPDTGVGDVDAMGGFCPLDEFHDIVRHVLRIEFPVPNPSRCAPCEAVENHIRIPLLRLLHQPPLVAAPVVLVVAGAHVARLGAVGRVHVAADLDFEMLERGPEVRLEKEVEDLAALGFRVIDEESR